MIKRALCRICFAFLHNVHVVGEDCHGDVEHDDGYQQTKEGVHGPEHDDVVFGRVISFSLGISIINVQIH